MTPLRCECCGDEHEDVGRVTIDGIPMVLCFLCQPCPYCGESGGACDPYEPEGGSCVNGGDKTMRTRT